MMDTLTCIEERRSTRGFLDKSLDRDILEKLLTSATRAPSAINLQPWEFTVVWGDERKRLSRVLVKRMRELNVSCGPGAKKPLPDYFVNRQRRLLEVMNPHLPIEIAFQDFINEGSCNFYGAPVGIIVTMDNAFSHARLTDVGIAVGYLVLAAHAMGLGTCPIGLITAFDEEIKEELSIPEEKRIVVGIAVGYVDPEASINEPVSERAAISEIVRWRG